MFNILFRASQKGLTIFVKEIIVLKSKSSLQSSTEFNSLIMHNFISFSKYRKRQLYLGDVKSYKED